MLTPKLLYQKNIDEKQWVNDSEQAQVVSVLETLFHEIQTNNPFKQILSSFLFRKKQLIKGVYIWGGVGRGKTELVDLFYNCVSISKKQRLHYYHFMRNIHLKLQEYKGEKDPLKRVADVLASQCNLIVLDEFFVNDIADAMILGRLLHFLFQNKVILITTSNLHPNQLYLNGLHRDRFLPTIGLIKKHLHIINLGGDIDFRAQHDDDHTIQTTYYCPLNQETHQLILKHFKRLTEKQECVLNKSIYIESRWILTQWMTHQIICFDFDVLCSSPRSAYDYISLAKKFHTLFLINIPILGLKHEDATRRFIQLVDELYDRRVTLIIAAAASLETLYQGEKLIFEYQRTLSRLKEMQSQYYINQPHQIVC